MPKANRSAADPGDFWVDGPLPKYAFGGYSHGWDINNHRYTFKVTEEQFKDKGLYNRVAQEVQEAVKAVFRKHYGDQDGQEK